MADDKEQSPEEIEEKRLALNARRRELYAAKKAAGPPRASSTGRVRDVPAVQDNWRTKLQQSRIKFDDEMKQIYLNQLAEHGMKGTAADAAGVCRQTVADHLENDPDFEAGFSAAMDTYRDRVVAHHTNLLFEGEITTKYDKDGNMIEEKHTYPVPLILAELRKVDPAYREKQDIGIDTGGGGVIVAPAHISPEDWIAREREENRHKTRPTIDITPEKD